MPETAPLISPSALAALNDGAAQTAHIEAVLTYPTSDSPDAARIGHFRLGNGLTVLLWPDSGAPVFAYQTWFGVGSRHERVGKTGIAHLFEHLMFKATKHHPEGEFDATMERHGAQTNAATWVDWTYYREKLPAGYLDLACSFEADRMEHLLLNDTQLESEREVVKNERLMRVDNDPEGTLNEKLYAMAFTQSSYGWPTIGWMADIEGLSLQDCNDFYQAYYAPNNATVVVVGDVDAEAALATIQKHYGHLSSQLLPEEVVRVEPEQTAERRVVLELPLSVPRIIAGYHSPAAGSPEHAAAEVLCELLAGGESSRLYQALIEDQEVASDAGGWLSSWRYPGLFELDLTLHEGGDVDVALAACDAVIAGIVDRASPVTQRELTKAINTLEAGSLRAAADTGARARRLGHAQTVAGDFRDYWAHQARVRAVTIEDVHAIAEKILRATNRTVVIGVIDAIDAPATQPAEPVADAAEVAP